MTILRRILRTLGWSATGLSIIAFLLGYAAPYLPPVHFWWTDLFAVFLFPLSLIVAGLGIGLLGQGLYQGSWMRAIVAIGLLVLVSIRFGPRLAAWKSPPPSPSSLQIMSLNVPPSFAGHNAPNRPLTALVRAVAPDILALQESRIETGVAASPPVLVRTSSSIRPLFDDTMGYALPRVLPPNRDIQQPVLGRLSLDSMSVHPLPPRGATTARSRYTRTRFTWQGRPAVLYNIHLHSVGPVRPWTTMAEDALSLADWRAFLRAYRTGARRRAQQARLIRQHIERESLPVLVVGDFNSTPHQWAYRHIAQGLQNAMTRGVRGWAATFPTQYPLVRIDHVLASPAWEVVSAQVPPPRGNNAPSDHRPVLAQLRWRQY